MKKCAVFTLMMTSFLIGCSSDGLLGVAYWMGSLGDPKDDFKFRCQIKLIKKDEHDNLFIQYHHENNQKNSSAFWVKSLDPLSGQHYAECLRFDVETNFDFFEDIVKNNDIQVWDYDGHKVAEGHYIGNKKQGTWKSWYRSGQLRSNNHYQNDQLLGLQQSWYQTGQQEIQAIYGEGNYQETYWYEKEDTLRETQQKIVNGLEHKTITEFDASNKITSIMQYEGKEIVRWDTF